MMCTASLAHHGLLGSLNNMWLNDVDLSPVPTQHLASLVSSVTRNLSIRNVSGCDIVSLLTSLKCERLRIVSQRLGREETRALVQAMESGVEQVSLEDELTLDMEALSQYSGQGRCHSMRTADINMIQMRTWATSKKWTVQHKSKYSYFKSTHPYFPDTQQLVSLLPSRLREVMMPFVLKRNYEKLMFDVIMWRSSSLEFKHNDIDPGFDYVP